MSEKKSSKRAPSNPIGNASQPDASEVSLLVSSNHTTSAVSATTADNPHNNTTSSGRGFSFFDDYSSDPLLRRPDDDVVPQSSRNALSSDLEDLDSSLQYRRWRSSSSRRLTVVPSTNMSTASSTSSRTLSTENSRHHVVAPSLRASLDAGMAAMKRWIMSHSSDNNNTRTRDPEEDDSFSLVPPTIFEDHDDNDNNDERMPANHGNRQRTRSEPDSASAQEFFHSSVRRRRRAYSSVASPDLTPPRPRSTSLVVNRDRQVLSSSAAAALSWTNSTGHPSPILDHYDNPFENLSLLNVHQPPLGTTATTSTTSAPVTAAATHLPVDVTPSESLQQQQQQRPMDVPEAAQTLGDRDREARARARWIRINRCFQFVITVVALFFSVLLFAILLCWVVLTSTYIASLDKPCDVGLKAYFWLVSLQLVLDVFRNDILRFIFHWDSSSHDSIPCRVIAYNMAYLVYALLVLRLGVMSVYMGNPTCKSTAPELFKASTAFVSLSLTAWGVILVGYVVPLFVVAGLLTCNGYNPMDSGPDHSGGPTAVFPAAYSWNGAPPGCIEQLPRVPVELLQQGLECCICMEGFGKDDVAVKTFCNHTFHKSCCREWLRQARTCPVCRADIPSTLEGIDEESRSGSGTADHTSRIPFGPTGRPDRGLFIRIFRHRTRDSGDAGSTPASSSASRGETRSSVPSDDLELGGRPTGVASAPRLRL